MLKLDVIGERIYAAMGRLRGGGLKGLTNIRGNAGHSVGVLRIRLTESRVGWKAKLGNAVLLI